MMNIIEMNVETNNRIDKISKISKINRKMVLRTRNKAVAVAVDLMVITTNRTMVITTNKIMGHMVTINKTMDHTVITKMAEMLIYHHLTKCVMRVHISLMSNYRCQKL
jgi:hypothetical protein